VLWIECPIIKQSLVLVHAINERHIVILAPSTEWVQKKDRVLEALFQKLRARILEK